MDIEAYAHQHSNQRSDQQLDEIFNYLAALVFGRAMLMASLMAIACAMVSGSVWKTIAIYVLTECLWLSGLGRRWLEKLTFAAIVGASIYWVVDPPVDRIVAAVASCAQR